MTESPTEDAVPENGAEATESSHQRGQYIVVARRYRPQGFTDLVGQSMVSDALKNAIETDRVGHAYLFTGARGVGKTSTARILSKALNCQRGPTHDPCHQCDICQAIASGDDVDVLEIDGASNRGIEEIRQLRANVSVRPSRCRYKIYIIDEVHMLTREAFNALLKTLEEPPEHVKFIFCTTDPEKIPITVLSRCQRFDFAPVGADEIVNRLRFIVESEGSTADDEALRLLARKAAGSVRDSQSLLEQLLSFTTGQITAEAVHQMLGTADTARLQAVVRAMANHDAAEALKQLDAAVGQGVDAGQLAEQLLGCIRDLLALSVGAGKELLLFSSDADAETLTEIAQNWGTANLLAAAQIIDQTLVRMRMVTQSRILLETALVRIACLEDLQQLADLVVQVQSGAAPASVKKKTSQPVATPAATAPDATKPAPANSSAPSSDAPNPAAASPAPSQSAPASLPAQQPAPASEPAARADQTAAEPPTKPATAPAPEPAASPQTPASTQVHAAHDAAPPAPAGNRAAAPAAAAQPVAVKSVTSSEPAASSVVEPASPPKEVPAATPAPVENAADAPTESVQSASAETQQVDAATPVVSGGSDAMKLWRAATDKFAGIASDMASDAMAAANVAPNRLVVTFSSQYTSSKHFCERPRQHGEMEQIVSELAGRRLKLEFAVREDHSAPVARRPQMSMREFEREIAKREYVKLATDLFSAELTQVIPRRED